jgi:hypothetical protein
MDRDQFKTWGLDFARRFPEAGGYVMNLSQATRDLWFEEVFSKHELKDALAVNRELDESGEGLAKYERDQLRGNLERLLRTQAFDRETREIENKRRTFAIHKAMAANPVMGPMLTQVTGKIREFKRETGELPPEETIARWTEQASREFDTTVEDELELPRYKCHHCRDLGLISYKALNAGEVIGACPHCDAGREKANNEKRSIGYAPGNAEDNQFNSALGSYDD